MGPAEEDRTKEQPDPAETKKRQTRMELKFETKKEYRGLGRVAGSTCGRGMLITGRNGCGKTRLLHEIARVIQAKEGRRRRPERHRQVQTENTAEIELSPLPDTCEIVGIAGGGTFISETRRQEEHDIAEGMKERAGVHATHSDQSSRERRRGLLTAIAKSSGTTYESLTTKQANDWLKEQYEGDRSWGASVTGTLAARQREIYTRIQERALEAAEGNQTMGEDIQELVQGNEYESINEILVAGGSLHVIKEVKNREWQEAIQQNFYASKPVEVLEVGTDGPVMTMGDLSTGEQKLLWLAGCALKADRWDPEQSKVVLLLDEFDTGLHPAMKKQFINMIESLAAKGIWVIATTHDPITVGLASEDWVHILESRWEGQRRHSELEQTTRKNAIQRMLGTTEIGAPYAVDSRRDEMTEREREEFDRIATACSALRAA